MASLAGPLPPTALWSNGRPEGAGSEAPPTLGETRPAYEGALSWQQKPEMLWRVRLLFLAGGVERIFVG